MLQGRLFAEGARSVLLVLQGLDASGKDGVIRRVFEGVNPMGVHVVSFRAPTETERAHDYFWRVHAELPPRGDIGVFNRSHYEDVVAVRMHALAPEEVWRRRPGHIREWERMLVEEGTTVVKVFLNVSKEEQRKRFQERIDDPEKRWKFRTADLDVRERFDGYLAAWDEVIPRPRPSGRRGTSCPPTGTGSRARPSRPCSSTRWSSSTHGCPTPSRASRAW